MAAVSTLVNQLGQAVPAFDIAGKTVQDIDYEASTGSAVQSAAVGAQCVAVMLTTEESSVRVAIGANPTATATSTRLPQGAMAVFQIKPGDKISAISNNATTGVLNITEITTPSY